MNTNDKNNHMILSDLAIVGLILSAILGLTACQKEGPAEKAGKQIDQAVDKGTTKLDETQQILGDKATQAGVYMDDTAITSAIKAEILSDPLLKVSEINVTTTKGVVRLSGEVDSQLSIDRAVQIAKRNQNAKTVENNLIIKPLR